MTAKQNSAKTVVCIMGPTASGKTSLAVKAAKALNAEVVSVDSALVYRGMNIGTAKPDEIEQDGITHHLIDMISPECSYSVADFLRDCNNAIEDIHSRGKLPILAGGTMMYFNALINGLNDLPAANATIREQIKQMSLEQIHAKLSEFDPKSANRININDSQRLTRALEVYMSSGKSLTDWQQQEKRTFSYKFIQFSIMPSDRMTLHKLIAQRFDQMLASGLIKEVEGLLMQYRLNQELPSMRSVGYRQVWQYLRGELSYTEMRERGIIATRQLAKRQVTWLRKWQDIQPLSTENKNNLQILIEKVGAT